MNIFMIRVELHDAIFRDYEILHAAMAAEGFSRQIQGSNGITYHLPSAEYSYIGIATGESVRTCAERAAAKTNKKFAVLVTQAGERLWSGLQAVR